MGETSIITVLHLCPQVKGGGESMTPSLAHTLYQSSLARRSVEALVCWVYVTGRLPLTVRKGLGGPLESEGAAWQPIMAQEASI